MTLQKSQWHPAHKRVIRPCTCAHKYRPEDGGLHSFPLHSVSLFFLMKQTNIKHEVNFVQLHFYGISPVYVFFFRCFTENIVTVVRGVTEYISDPLKKRKKSP